MFWIFYFLGSYFEGHLVKVTWTFCHYKFKTHFSESEQEFLTNLTAKQEEQITVPQKLKQNKNCKQAASN